MITLRTSTNATSRDADGSIEAAILLELIRMLQQGHSRWIYQALDGALPRLVQIVLESPDTAVRDKTTLVRSTVICHCAAFTDWDLCAGDSRTIDRLVHIAIALLTDLADQLKTGQFPVNSAMQQAGWLPGVP